MMNPLQPSCLIPQQNRGKSQRHLIPFVMGHGLTFNQMERFSSLAERIPAMGRQQAIADYITELIMVV